MKRRRLGTFTVWEPSNRRERARGLLGRDGLGQHEAMWLSRCRSVHTFGMRFVIDVVMIDRDDQVLGVARMEPRRVLFPRLRTRHIVEVAAGRSAAFTRSLAARTTRDARSSEHQA